MMPHTIALLAFLAGGIAAGFGARVLAVIAIAIGLFIEVAV